MSLLKLLQREEKKPLGICIPEHQRKRTEKLAKEETKKAIKSDAAFEVTDYFQIHEFAVIRGNVLKGIITNKDKLLIEGKKIKIAELWVNDKKVNMLNEGDSGAIFINARGLRLQPGEIVQVE
jgi:selenocysteine-specific translation elongation factor